MSGRSRSRNSLTTLSLRAALLLVPALWSCSLSPRRERLSAADRKPRLAEGRFENGKEGDRDERLRWFWKQRAAPDGSMPIAAYQDAVRAELARDDRQALAIGDPWTSLGPAPLKKITYGGSSTQDASGRTLTVALQPGNPATVLLGTALGGIWKSTDGAASFRSVGESALPSLAVNVIRFAPGTPTTVYAGTGEPHTSESYFGYGVVKSTDAGETWRALPAKGTGWNFEQTGIGGLVVDPRNANVVTITTASIHTFTDQFKALSIPQTGIFRSTDGGQTWTLLKAATPRMTALKRDDVGFVDLEGGGQLAPDLLYATEWGGGIYRSDNNGQTWTLVTRTKPGGSGDYPVDVPSLAFLGQTRFFLLDRFRLRDDQPEFNRIEIAVAPSNPNVVYAGYAATALLLDADDDGKFDSTKDIFDDGGLLFKSTDKGAHWTFLGTSLDGIPNYCHSQCDYDNAIAVNPADENDVSIGGSGEYSEFFPSPVKNPTSTLQLPWRGMIHRSLDGGRSWVDTTPHCTRVAQTPTSFPVGNNQTVSAYPCVDIDTTRVIHPDIHAITYAPNGQVYVGNDGGLYRQTRSGAGTSSFDYSWENLTNGLSTLQFYFFDVHPTDPNKIVGGLQDNSVGYYNGTFWDGWGYGDGTLGLFDPVDPNHVYIGTQNNVHRHDAGGAKLFIDKEGNPASGWHLSIFGGSSVNDGEGVGFVPVFAVDPVRSGTVYGASDKALYRSTNRGDSFSAITGITLKGEPTSISVSPANNNLVWVATSEGYLYLYDVGANSILQLGDDLPSRYLPQVLASRTSADTVYAVFSGYGVNTPTSGTGHVYKSTNRGQSFTNITGNLPDVPVSTIAVDPGNPDRIWIGNDIGVYATLDGGATWASDRANMPVVPVLDMKLNTSTGFLTIATHGRGVWRKAAFAAGFALSVAKAGTGSGTVTSNPAGISCGSACTATFASGASVSLAASPATGSTFAGWSGACTGTGACSVAMTAARSVTATFNGTGAQPDFALSASPLSVSAAQGGSATAQVSTSVSGGFSAAVLLSATGVPAGASASFSPTQIGAPGAGSATLTLRAGTGTPAGAYSITVTGSGGGRTHTATVSFTVTSTAGSCTSAELLRNNGFESGNAPSGPSGTSGTSGFWNWYSTGGVNPILMDGGAGTGDWVASLGFFGFTEEDRISQQVTIPAGGTAVLSYDRRILTQEEADRAWDYFVVEVRTTSDVLLQTLRTYSNLDGDGLWYHAAFDLSAFGGQTVRIYFRSLEDANTVSGILIDDVYLSVACGANPNGDPLLAIKATGDGTGNVRIETPGIGCSGQGSCATFVPVNTTVTVSATPASGSRFAGWLGACSGTGPCTIDMRSSRGVTAVFAVGSAGPPQQLLLANGRVSVAVDWRSQYDGSSGRAYAIPQKDEFGFFYYTNPNNPEVFVKVLDFGSGKALCFVGGLSDFFYKVTFTNVRTGQTLVFEKQAGQLLGFADNTGLSFLRSGGPGGGGDSGMLDLDDTPAGVRAMPEPAASLTLASVEPLATQQLALAGGRVTVTVDWQSQYNGTSGKAFAIPQKDEFGFFYYTDPNNPEVFVKVLDFGSGKALCFVGGLSDFFYRVTFRSVRTGETLVFEKPAGQLFGFANGDRLSF